jgi:hypothetical protein
MGSYFSHMPLTLQKFFAFGRPVSESTRLPPGICASDIFNLPLYSMPSEVRMSIESCSSGNMSPLKTASAIFHKRYLSFFNHSTHVSNVLRRNPSRHSSYCENLIQDCSASSEYFSFYCYEFLLNQVGKFHKCGSLETNL